MCERERERETGASEKNMIWGVKSPLLKIICMQISLNISDQCSVLALLALLTMHSNDYDRLTKK